jgi:hypothetical protein
MAAAQPSPDATFHAFRMSPSLSRRPGMETSNCHHVDRCGFEQVYTPCLDRRLGDVRKSPSRRFGAGGLPLGYGRLRAESGVAPAIIPLEKGNVPSDAAAWL